LAALVMAPCPYCCARPSRPAGCAAATDCRGPGGDCERRPVRTRRAGKNPARSSSCVFRLFRFVRYRWRCSMKVSRKADFPRKTPCCGPAAPRCVPNRRCRDPAPVRRSRRRLRRRSGRSGRRRCTAAGRCPRPPHARSRLPRHLRGLAGRTWCRAGCSP
jgi:hypothetical protein